MFCTTCGNEVNEKVKDDADKTLAKATLPQPSQAQTLVSSGHQAGERKVLTIQGVEWAFRWCPAGEFQMGSPEGELGRDSDESQHRVMLRRGFWLLETEVTQKMWESVMGSNPSHFKGSNLPVETVSWNDCQDFVTKLNGLGVSPSGFRFSLPTEAQWEYACRAGTTTALNSGKNLTDEKYHCSNLNELGWYDWQNKETTTHPVGLKKPNAWGLCDMHGNVWEWCSDWYGDYPTGSVTDPLGASSGSDRVCRGGCWGYFAESCRSANRGSSAPGYSFRSVGLRVSLVSGDK
jgi:formylglycine-generating enzyme required for sulfatase activity